MHVVTYNQLHVACEQLVHEKSQPSIVQTNRDSQVTDRGLFYCSCVSSLHMRLILLRKAKISI